MRPGVARLERLGVPRAAGIAVHYVVLLGLVGLFLWLVVPQAIDQVQAALGGGALGEEAQRSTGLKHDILTALDRELQNLPSTSELFEPAVEYGRKAVEVVVAIFFTFAAAAYWLYERDRAVDLVCSLIARPRRKKVRDTWELVDAKLGTFVRGQLVLIVLVGAVLSLAFWAIGLPYWLLVGAFAGLVEIVPVIGPLVAGIAAIGVGLTDSTHVAVLAGVIVVVVRLLEDYLVIPKLMGHSVGLSPLVVLVSVTSVGILLGGYAVVLAIPIASLAATVIDVAVRNRDPAQEDVPALRLSERKTE
jgi:predicted PurR-regulated permease PerM